MVITPYLPRKFQIKFWLRNFKLPQVWTRRRMALKNLHSNQTREILRKKIYNNSWDEFQTLCADLICDVMPICFLEGFQEVKANSIKIGFPKRPEVIFTSNNFDTDEEFKFWVAEMTSLGSKYIIGQHGSNYGVDFVESPFNEETIADKFITGAIINHIQTAVQVCIYLPHTRIITIF